MEKLISAFPDNITEAIAIAEKSSFKPLSNKIDNIVICGMGGSGIGGKLVQKWVEEELSVPVLGIQDYNLPAFVSKNTLLIGSSYSGNTEETLSALEEGIAKGATLIGVCSGGKLKEMCDKHNFDCIVVPGGNPPRTALAFSLVQLLNIFASYDLISRERLTEIERARQLIVENEKSIKKIAKELASFLRGNVGILYGTTKYEPLLVRARQQFNENSKHLCWHHVIPEMNHNELVGWGGGDDRFATVLFNSEDIHPRNKKRLEITIDAIKKKSSKLMIIDSKGESFIEKTIYFINIVDWASLYLAEMDKVDPIDIAIIDFLKSELANFN